MSDEETITRVQLAKTNKNPLVSEKIRTELISPGDIDYGDTKPPGVKKPPPPAPMPPTQLRPDSVGMAVALNSQHYMSRRAKGGGGRDRAGAQYRGGMRIRQVLEKCALEYPLNGLFGVINPPRDLKNDFGYWFCLTVSGITLNHIYRSGYVNTDALSVCYHGTSVTNLASISLNGLRPDPTKTKNKKGIYCAGEVRKNCTYNYVTYLAVPEVSPTWVWGAHLKCLADRSKGTIINHQWVQPAGTVFVTHIYLHAFKVEDLRELGDTASMHRVYQRRYYASCKGKILPSVGNDVDDLYRKVPWPENFPLSRRRSLLTARTTTPTRPMRAHIE